MSRMLHFSSLLLLLASVGCMHGSSSIYQRPRDNIVSLVDGRDYVLAKKFTRAQLLEMAGPPTIDDGDEWIYVTKCEDTGGLALGMLLAVYGSVNDPVWKLVVVTFDLEGLAEKIRVASVDSSINEGVPSRYIILGTNFDRKARFRAATVGATTQTAD